MRALDVAVVMFLVAPAAGIAATAYLWVLYRADPARPPSWLLAVLSHGSSVVNVAALWFAVLAAVRLAGLEVPRWSAVPSAGAFLALEAVPVYYAAVMYGRAA